MDDSAYRNEFDDEFEPGDPTENRLGLRDLHERGETREDRMVGWMLVAFVLALMVLGGALVGHMIVSIFLG